MCVHYYPRIPTEACKCEAAEYPHLHGRCAKCRTERTFKFYNLDDYGVVYATAEYESLLLSKRKAGQQSMRKSISLGARPGERWVK